ncbi:MAG: hypothetical protein LBL55_11395 [Propionibacteriaceae bacterium]|jgi:hypothetical protein|nr:hypothetical protein [Propionibacteriaceae bacterium]
MAERTGRPPHTLTPPPWDNPSAQWDRLDLALMEAFWAVRAVECPDCGRPLAEHENDAPADYDVYRFECTRRRAISDHTEAWSRGRTDLFPPDCGPEIHDDKRRREAGSDPEWPRRYVARSEAEGPPVLTLPD